MPHPFHLAFHVRDLDEARAFYGGVLGAAEGRSAPTWVDFDFFGHQLSLHLGEPFATTRTGRVGDSYDRYIVRLLEIQESVRLVREAVKLLPPKAEKENDPVGGFQAEVAKQLRKPPKGEVRCRTEAPRGEMGYVIVSDGTKVPYRVRCRTGSFTACGIFNKLMKGIFLGDVVTVIGSFDIVVPEIDR